MGINYSTGLPQTKPLPSMSATSLSSVVPVSASTPNIFSSTVPAIKATSTYSTAAPSSTVIETRGSSALAADILVIARDSTEANVASSGLNAYGIPFTTLLVPQEGVQLPDLDSAAGGKFAGIVITGEVSYDYGNGTWASALAPSQWNQLYAYQLKYGARLVEYDVSPGEKFGTKGVTSGCCKEGVEQLVSFSDTSDFPTAGLRTGAGVSTKELWHYPAEIVNSTTTKVIAKFASNQVIKNETAAAVINNFNGRQQMAFFTAIDPTWNPTSAYLQHAWITWITRGLYAGYRRVNLNTQIDDMFLSTRIYKSERNFRLTPADLDGITSWLPAVRSRLNPGSTYFVEVGHNGNGNIEAGSGQVGSHRCSGGSIQITAPAATPPEFKKPLGTASNLWPETPNSFNWSDACMDADELLQWWKKNLNEYAHISHTFTHLSQDNVSYSDVSKEITFNQAWLSRVGISSATRYTANGIIPPAITGLHNGDALQAWSDHGITNCVGDSSRPVLRNQQNPMWPYFTSVSADGFNGMQVNPRWATRIYFDCDSPECTFQQWADVFSGTGDFNNLLEAEEESAIVNLLGLYHDSYMFHQANLRNANSASITVGSSTGRYSIFQAWVETVVQELSRLVTWPIVSTTHQQVIIP